MNKVDSTAGEKLVKSIANNCAFRRINEVGLKISTPYCLVITCSLELLSPPLETGSCYLGIKATKKLGCAVVRNKIKRRFRHIVRDLAKAGDINGLAIVVIARRQCLADDFAKVYNSFRFAVVSKRGKLIKAKDGTQAPDDLYRKESF